MKKDLKESLMLLANNDMSEYRELMRMSVEDFLIRYKLFIDEIESKTNNGG